MTIAEWMPKQQIRNHDESRRQRSYHSPDLVFWTANGLLLPFIALQMYFHALIRTARTLDSLRRVRR